MRLLFNYDKALERAKQKSEYYQQLKEIKTIENQFKPHMETYKVMAIFLLVLLNVIIIYALVAMWHFRDLTYLGALITDIASQVLIYAIYCTKAFKGKKEEELIKLQREQLVLPTEEEPIFEDTSN